MSKHDYEKEIVCPYCDYRFRDSWEHNEEGSSEITCHSCEKEFLVSVNIEVSYSTSRKPCTEHVWGQAIGNVVRQATVDKWNAEKFMRRTDHAPHIQWKRECANCDDYQYKHTPLGQSDPWAAAQTAPTALDLAAQHQDEILARIRGERK